MTSLWNLTKKIVFLFFSLSIITPQLVFGQITSQSSQGSSKSAVTFPGNEPVYSLSIEGLWLRPTSTKLLYAVVDPYQQGPDQIQGKLKGLEHGSAPGARIVGAYRMSPNSAGFGFAFSRLKSGQNSMTTKNQNEDFWGLLLHANSIIDDDNVTHIQLSTEFTLTEGLFESRMSMGLGRAGSVFLSGGLQYSQIIQDFNVNYIQQVTQVPPILERRVIINKTNSCRGFGPRIALGAEWNMGGASIYGQLGVAMLMSSIGASVHQQDWRVGAVNGIERVNVDMPYGARVVPVANMRLGLGYNYTDNWGYVGIYGGYEVANYFNAISQYEFYDDVDSQLGANDQSDIGLDGYFLGLKAVLGFRGI